MIAPSYGDPASLTGAPGLVDPSSLNRRMRELLRFVAMYRNVVRTPQGWGLRGDGTGERFSDRTIKAGIDKGLIRKALAPNGRSWQLLLTGSGQNTLSVMDLRERASRGQA